MQQDEAELIESALRRIQEARRAAQRLSIDEALEQVGVRRASTGQRTAVAAALAEDLRETVRRGGGSSPSQSADDAPPVALHELPQLDGYDIVGILGRGGMGVVYEAYQRSTGRRVAVKTLLAGATGEAARRRFEREVDLAARLDHPGVVSVLDSFIHEGRYFYVMEYVDGVPLDEAFPPGSADARDVLAALAAVCETIDYAHQRGVLHRDLKPSNILVVSRPTSGDAGAGRSGSPRFKVLDFGLAKAFDPQTLGWRDVTLSQPGQLLGTLGFMSPEQAAGRHELTSVRSDVYSLGAILYEALCGCLPCPVDGPLADVLRRLSEFDPAPPSRLRPGLSRDVDAVVLKAIDRDPQRRYATAAEFGADLLRLLRHEPPLARPGGALLRMRRFVRRHKAMVAGVAGVFCALVAGIAATTHQAVRATRAEALALSERDEARAARDHAEDALRKAQTTTAVLAGVLDVPDPTRIGADPVAQLNDASALVAAEFADSPEREADLRYALCLGYLFAAQADYFAAVQGAIREAKTALELRERAFGTTHPLTVQSMIQLAHVLITQKRLEAAEPLIHEAVRIARDRPKVDGEELVFTLSMLVMWHRDAGRPQEAVAAARKAVKSADDLLSPTDLKRWVMRSYLLQALLLAGFDTEANALAADSFERAQALAGPTVRSDICVALLNSLAYSNTGRSQEAANWSARHRALIESVEWPSEP